MNYNISADVFQEPFPHIIFHNFYDEHELKLIWEELDFFTKDGILMLTLTLRWNYELQYIR